ncbi:MAG: T9SS type A sorting domain-containing protein [Syntrophothermus sp.]
MKHHSLQLVLFILLITKVIIGYSQESQFKIGVVTNSIYHDSVNVVLSEDHMENYLLDINQDGIKDFSFKTTTFSSASSGSIFKTEIFPSDSTYIFTKEITDTKCDPIQKVNIIYKYFLVDRFEFGASVDNDTVFSNEKSYLSSYEGASSYWPVCVTDTRDYWVGKGFKYIGFKKIIRGTAYLGWIQINVMDYDHIEIKDFGFTMIPTKNNDTFNNAVSIFPNPAYNFIQLTSPDVRSYKIFNCYGEQLIKSPFKSNQSIDISNLTQGVYILLIATDKGEKSLKFIKN